MIGNRSSQVIARRSAALALVIALGAATAGCSPFAASVADHWPHWAGGLPADAPPRPGAPGYDEFIAHGQADQQAAKSGAVAATPGGQPGVATAAAAPAAPAAAPAGIPAAPRSAPAAVPAEPAAPASEEPDDTSAVRGGLY